MLLAPGGVGTPIYMILDVNLLNIKVDVFLLVFKDEFTDRARNSMSSALVCDVVKGSILVLDSLVLFTKVEISAQTNTSLTITVLSRFDLQLEKVVTESTASVNATISQTGPMTCDQFSCIEERVIVGLVLQNAVLVSVELFNGLNVVPLTLNGA